MNDSSHGAGFAGSRRTAAPVRLLPALPADAPVELTEAQRVVVDHRDGVLLTLGGPGTGKTTALVEAMVADSRGRDERRPLLLTFSRRTAAELRARVGLRIGRASVAPQVFTFHGLCHSLVRRFGAPGQNLPRLLTAPEQEFRVREILSGQRAGRWPAAFDAARGTRGFSSEVRQALARARQLGLDPDDLRTLGEQAMRPEWCALGSFFDEYLDVLDAEGVLDYAELVHRCRILLTDPDVIAHVRAETGRVLVDEFHDTDPAQADLLRRLVGEVVPTVIVGDPDQSVFAFRGAQGRGILDVPDLWPGKVAVHVLPTGFRQPAALASAAARVAARLPWSRLVPGATPGAVREPAPAPGKGRVDVRTFDTAGAEAEHIVDLLRSAHLHDGLAWSDMAVLVRSGRRTIPPLSRALTAAGVPVEVAGDEIALSAEQAVRPLLLGLTLAEREPEPDEAFRLVTSPVGGLDTLQVRRLARVLRAAEKEEWGESSGRLGTPALLQRALIDPDVRAGLPDTPEVVALNALADLLDSVRAVVVAGGSAHEALWTLWSGTDWPQRLLDASRSGTESARRASRDLDAVCALFDVASRTTDIGGRRGVSGFLTEVSAQQIPADTQREADVRGRGVRIMTTHRAKGQQWPLVVVAGVQEGVWPDLRRRGGLLEPDRLQVDGFTERAPGSVRVAEERRLFYVACTRASAHLVVTSVSGTEGEADQPSRFLTELDVPVRHVTGRPSRPLTLAALVAHLRQVCLDDERPEQVRDAAAARLAVLADAVDDHGLPLAPAADPARWWGVLPVSGGALARVGTPDEPLSFTGSQLGSLLSCPRKWFLDRQVRADEVRGSASTLGTVVHALAERARTDQLDDEALREGLDRVWQQIPFDAAWMSASERVEAEAALERFLAWQQNAQHRDVVGVEVPFEVSVEVDGEPVLLRGSIDRLERTLDGNLRVIDFKTARRAATANEAAALDQLGLYQLAVREGDFGGDGLAPAELVYVRVEGASGSVLPKVMTQPSLDEQPYLTAAQLADPDDAVRQRDYPSWVHFRLAQARDVLRSQRFEARPGGACRYCPFASSCPTTARGGRLLP